jgi:hypothetical protein
LAIGNAPVQLRSAPRRQKPKTTASSVAGGDTSRPATAKAFVWRTEEERAIEDSGFTLKGLPLASRRCFSTHAANRRSRPELLEFAAGDSELPHQSIERSTGYAETRSRPVTTPPVSRSTRITCSLSTCSSVLLPAGPDASRHISDKGARSVTPGESMTAAL